MLQGYINEEHLDFRYVGRFKRTTFLKITHSCINCQVEKERAINEHPSQELLHWLN